VVSVHQIPVFLLILVASNLPHTFQLSSRCSLSHLRNPDQNSGYLFVFLPIDFFPLRARRDSSSLLSPANYLFWACSSPTMLIYPERWGGGLSFAHSYRGADIRRWRCGPCLGAVRVIRII
jgi:hypothetical protein